MIKLPTSQKEYQVKVPIKRYMLVIGLLTTVIVSIVILFQKPAICQHIQSDKSSVKIEEVPETPLTMNITRANVIMEYNMSIIYVWLEKQMLLQYKQRLEWVTFPHRIIGQQEWNTLGKQFHQFNLQTSQKVDLLSLLYLQKYAGIISDFNNIIDYKCLMKMIARKRGFWMAGLPFVSWQPFASNSFLFVDRPNEPSISNVIKKIKQKIASLKKEEVQSIHSVYQVTGLGMLSKLKVQKMDDLYKCLDYQQNSFWGK